VTAVIEAKNLSKWYGNVLGLSDVTLEISAGITGLLGPNGAGKSTFMKLITGQIKPSIGEVTIHGRRVWNNYHLFSRLGFCPEQDAFYEEMTGGEFLRHLLGLYRFPAAEIEDRAEKTLVFVELDKDENRLIRGYSRGMRQRLKLAQAVAHDPDIIILDEPLNGLDPLGKRKVIRLIKEYRDAGKTVIVSSHVLPEIEALTRTIILLHQGKILARGDIHYIRDLIDTHPHMISVRCSDPRGLASALIGEPWVLDVRFGAEPGTVVFETQNRDKLFGALPRLVVDRRIDVEEINSPDDNLQAVFDYLVGK
jgi:ABC-2 type transport system ATP-binding protein